MDSKGTAKTMTDNRPHERLILALDGENRKDLLTLADRLTGGVGSFKVGLEAFVRWGPSFVAEVAERGSVFLDLKLHDIPNTVAGAAAAAAGYNISLLTVHATGGRAMIAAAVEAVRRGADLAERERPKILAVTILTSLAENDLTEIGFAGSATDRVVALARLAIEAGADGIVCSPLEVAPIRSALGAGPLVVTPGIRPAGAEAADQARAATPAMAITAGADRLVVGRPITGATDPVAAAAAIVAQIGAALRHQAV